MQRFLRGQVWWEKTENNQKDKNLVHGVQSTNRPVLVVSNNIINRTSCAIQVAPITSKSKTDIIEHVIFRNMNREDNVILIEQIRTVPKETLTTYIGTLEDSIMLNVDKAILQCFGLSQEPIVIEDVESYEEERIENKVIEVAEEEPKSSKKVAKRFSKQERKMILNYLEYHSVLETTKFFLEKFNLPYNALYQRVRNLYKKQRVGNKK